MISEIAEEETRRSSDPAGAAARSLAEEQGRGGDHLRDARAHGRIGARAALGGVRGARGGAARGGAFQHLGRHMRRLRRQRLRVSRRQSVPMGGQPSAIVPESTKATTTPSKGSSGTATLHADRRAERGADPDADPG